MRIPRRTLLAAPALGLVAPAARAEEWPSRPVRVIVPYAAGGADQFIRPLQARFAEAFGQPLVIESVTGGGGAIGAQRVRQSAADGYTLLFAGTGALTAVPRLQRLGYSIADFAPIANLIAIPYLFAAKPGAPFRDLAGFLAAARVRPEGLSYGTPGIGSTPHLVTEALSRETGIRLLHVPYSGIATAVVGLLAGDIDLVVGAPGNIMPLVERGVQPLAQTGATRIAPLAAIPTLRENGISAELVTRFGFLAPRGTPAAMIERFADLVLREGADPAYVAAMRRSFNEVELLDSARFAEFLAAEDRTTARLLQDLALQ